MTDESDVKKFKRRFKDPRLDDVNQKIPSQPGYDSLENPHYIVTAEDLRREGKVKYGTSMKGRHKIDSSKQSPWKKTQNLNSQSFLGSTQGSMKKQKLKGLTADALQERTMEKYSLPTHHDRGGGLKSTGTGKPRARFSMRKRR